MKRKFVFTIIFSFLICCGYAQKISLIDLALLCNKKNWEDVNQSLVSKGWEYHDSKKGDAIYYNTIAWSFNKNYYDDKAVGWMHLYTYEGFPNKISFQTSSQTVYASIQSSIAGAGFKLVDSEINDDEIKSTYKNSGYILEISNAKVTNDAADDGTSIAYVIVLIKKSGVYDLDNGIKTEYYENGLVKSKYTLVNGKLHGEKKTYYESGVLKKVGNYSNGKEHGHFIKYDEDGSVYRDYWMLNDEYNGISQRFKNGKITESTTYKAGLLEGKHIIYHYDENSGELISKDIENYLNDQLNGVSEYILIEKGKEKRLVYATYLNGIENGPFQFVTNDSLTIGQYKEGLLDGIFKQYWDSAFTLNGTIEIDVSKLKLISVGNYSLGKREGNWRVYDNYGIMISEGNYLGGEKNGEWKYYYETTFDSISGSKKTFSGELQEVVNYSKGLLNGPYRKVDEFGNTVESGNHLNNRREGEWLFRVTINTTNELNRYIKGNYIHGEKSGKWLQYKNELHLLATYNYLSDRLNGDYTILNSVSKPSIVYKYEWDKVNSVLVYDSLGNKVVRKYEVLGELDKGYNLRSTIYNEEGYCTQEYWLSSKVKMTPEASNMLFYVLNSIELHVTLGFKNGAYCLFSTDNKKLIEGSYFHNEKAGRWVWFDYAQNIKKVITYSPEVEPIEHFFTVSGEIYSGEYTVIRTSENTKEVIKIKNGLRDGNTTLYYLDTGKKLMKTKYKKGKVEN